MSASEQLLAEAVRDLRKRVEALEALEVAPPNIGARVYNSAALSIAHNTTTTLTFNSERYDTDGLHSTSSNTSRLTCTRAGKHLITAHIEFVVNATGVRQLELLLNSASLIAVQTITSVAGLNANMALATIYDLAVGDYVEVRVYQNSGGALNVAASAPRSPEFAMHRLA